MALNPETPIVVIVDGKKIDKERIFGTKSLVFARRRQPPGNKSNLHLKS